MKIISICLSFFFYTSILLGQYFQQEVNYNIKADLDGQNRLIRANCVIDYHNNSNTVLDTVYFHLWANAFSSKSSAFAHQLIKNQNLDFHFAKPEVLGGYQEIVFRGKGEFKMDQKNPDLGYVVLSNPLDPDDSVLLEFDYELKIPDLFSRLGINDNGDIHLVHWYPKPAVYDEKGWHWFPYLSMGEFYSEYGTFNVQLTGGVNYTLGSTGIKINGTDKKIHHFLAEKVFDFALFLVKDGMVISKKYPSTSGRMIELNIVTSKKDEFWQADAMNRLSESIAFYEQEIGPYLYPQLTLVNGQNKISSGMEYPMIIEVSAAGKEDLKYYINHEVGHQWFYAQLGFNEREEPFLDEGLTTFYEHKYTKAEINSEHHTQQLSPWNRASLEMPLLQYIYVLQKRRGFSESPSDDPQHTSMINYGLNAYERAAYVYRFLEDYIGRENFQSGIRAFFNEWKGRHPSLSDLVKTLSVHSDKNISWVQSLLATDYTIDYMASTDGNETIITNNGNLGIPAKVSSEDTTFWIDQIMPGDSYIFLSKSKNVSVNYDHLGLEKFAEDNHTNKPARAILFGLGLDHSQKNELYYLPAIRYNYADGLGLGVSLYNSTLLPKKFQYLIDPHIGLRSKKVVGNAWMSYDFYPDHSNFRKIQTKLSVKRYSDFYSEELDVNTEYIRFSPQLSLHWKSDPSSLTYRKFTLQSVLLRTEQLSFAGQNDFDINNDWSHFIKARYDYFNFKAINRVEYWSEIEFHSYKNPLQESEHFLKWTAAFDYNTPYALGRNINIRLFASGFLANTQRNAASFNNVFTKGSIALLSQSFNDYTRSEYFLNRQQMGNLHNQIGVGGGGFKDALGSAYNIGMSNDWAIAANFNIDLPVKLPFYLKLKPYFDVGYYQTKTAAVDQLKGETLISGGLMLSYLDGGLELYFPLYANQPINNIYKAENEKFYQKISFKIDLHRLNPWDLINDLNL